MCFSADKILFPSKVSFCYCSVLFYNMTSLFVTLLSGILVLGISSEAAKILGFFAFPSKSHVGAYTPLFEELARNGHEVTVYTPFPTNKKIANYKEVPLEDTFPARGSNGLNFFKIGNAPILITSFFMKRFLLESCEKILAQSNVQRLIHSKDMYFDLVIYEPFHTQCIYGLIHKFNAPTIQIIPNTLISWLADTVGNPSTSAFIPNMHSSSEEINFISRLKTLVMDMFMTFFRSWLIEPEMDAIMRKHFTDPTLPSIRELERNASFLFLSSHPVINHPRPLTPNTIEVGGLHIKTGKALPKDLKTFLDDAPNGVVYFSLGSNVRSVDMPDEMRNAILKSFSKLKEKVLWKWEADILPGQPANVRLGKWLPQHDILAHPNVKLFITHGGLMSLQEVTYFGVPVIAIPVAIDQKFNADVAKNRGLGVVLNVENITEEAFDWALQEVLNQPKYREAAKRVSNIFRDQPQTAMERAVFWTECTIRHRGAKHLHSAALDLNFFQYHLLDVIAVLSIVVISSVLLFSYVAILAFRRLCSKKANSTKKIAKKKN